jgi:hypothetical protein
LAIIILTSLLGLGWLCCFVWQDIAIEASFNAIGPDDTEQRLTERLGKPFVNTWDTPDGTYKTLTWKRITWDKRTRLISVDLLPSGAFLRKGLYGDGTFLKRLSDWGEWMRRFIKELR